MKKKNVIGHMEANKHETEGWFKRLHLLPRLVCLVIAVVIWLCVANLNASGISEITPEGTETEVSEI